MIKRIFITTSLFMVIQSSFGQRNLTFQDSIATYFDEIKVETKRYQKLWEKDLYEPMLLVNTETRQVFANFPDSAGCLKQNGKIYSGVFPNEINIANTSINWNGRHWAMIMLPLPENKKDRINLLAHELFHVSQRSLGFRPFNPENNHLDQMKGRIYLRLELEALKKAILANNKIAQKVHLTNALFYRKYRYSLYSGADSTENLLELNEGITEYTGSVISGRNNKQSIDHYVQSINTFLKSPTFVRSFAYQTIPVYGYLLLKTKKGWNREITINSNLTDYFIKAFDISLPNDLKKAIDLTLNQYNGELIISEETAREEKTKKFVADCISKYVTQPHFELAFEQMNMSFDYRIIVPIEEVGTLYPIIRVTDNWGVLTVENGALMSAKWDKISVTIPLVNEHKFIKGDGWTLELKNGYSVTKDNNTGNYKLTKN
jgi:hypothetical protein